MRYKKLNISKTFLCFIAISYYFDGEKLVLPTLLACFLHEMGHYLAIRLVGANIGTVQIGVFGASMPVVGMMGYGAEIFCAVSGPLVNLACAHLFSRFSWGYVFSGIHLSLAIFNLLPVSKLDGGRILSCFLHLLLNGDRAERMSYYLDLFFSFLLLLSGFILFLNGSNLMLLLLGGWLFVGAIEKKKKGFG